MIVPEINKKKVLKKRKRKLCPTEGYGNIWCHSKLHGTLLGQKGPYWSKQDHAGPYGTILGHTGPYWAIQGHTGPYKTIPDLYWTIKGIDLI